MKYTITIISAYLLLITGCTESFSLTGEKIIDNYTGTIFNDKNYNGLRDWNEPGIPNVKVSNGTDVVATNSKGHYKLDVSDDCIVFVIKPAGWKTPFDKNNLPLFYYINKPAGSPSNLRFPGIAPTGPQPTLIDFPLRKQSQPDKFDVVLFGDIQTSSQHEVAYFRRQLAEVIGIDAKLGISLGDNVGNNLSELDDVNQAVATVSLPWYNTAGNHDMNFLSPDDAGSLETFKSIYGPPNYSFNYGNAHFIILDSIIAKRTEKQDLQYDEGLNKEALTFVANDLKHVSKDTLVILLMHGGVESFPKQNRHELFKIIETFDHTLSIAGHDHFLKNSFFDQKENYHSKNPHHHYIAGAVCGSWWMGTPNADSGTPHSMMYDGAPAGYTILSLNGNKYSIKYKGFGKPADYQMTLYAPDEVTIADLPSTQVTANIFVASKKATVEMKIDDSKTWLPMQFTPSNDPHFVNMTKWEEQNNIYRHRWAKKPRELHIWKAPLPENLTEGLHVITVRSKNTPGQTYSAKRIIKVK